MRFIKSNKKCNACPPVVQVHYMTHSVSPLRLVVFFSVYMSYHTGNIIYGLIMITSVSFFQYMFQTGKLPDLLIVSHYTEEYFIWISVGPSFIVSMETGHCIRYTMHDSFCFQNCLNSSRHRFNMETFIRDFRPILTSYWHHDIAAYLSAAHPQCSFLFRRILKMLYRIVIWWRWRPFE